jgi:hypothetical protein
MGIIWYLIEYGNQCLDKRDCPDNCKNYYCIRDKNTANIFYELYKILGYDISTLIIHHIYPFSLYIKQLGVFTCPRGPRNGAGPPCGPP